MDARSIAHLTPLDAPALERFLARHAESSMFLRSNMRRAGLEDRRQPFQGTYVAAVENGEITAVVAARLELTITHNADNWGATGRTIDLHQLTQAWTETRTTWNCADDTNTGNPVTDCSGAPASAMDGPDPRPYAATPTATRVITNGLRGVVTLDVTANVRALASGGGAQHGWILRKTDEGASGQVEFRSRMPSVSFAVRINTDDLAPATDLGVAIIVPSEFLTALPADHVVGAFAQFLGGGEGEPG